jgi:hypothetical protein
MGMEPASLSVGDCAGLASAVVAALGVVIVYLQIRGSASASRAQATIQFQRAFRDSGKARFRLLTAFPVHESLLTELEIPDGTPEDFETWSTVSDLTKEQVADARAVVGAMNDVAQYVADGLQMGSALQQYHTIFVRVGALVLPYLDEIAAPVEGKSQSRFGRRMVNLYNAGIAYQIRHPKHRDRQLVLERPSVQEERKVHLILIDPGGRCVEPHLGFSDEQDSRREPLPRRLALRWAIRRAERGLRR